ncbi:MAG: cytochrome b/b6 domain-containing protein [Albidovulum sp.]
MPPVGSRAKPAAASVPSPDMVRVWDPFVRIFHWSLVTLFAFCYVTGDHWEDYHEPAGYLILFLLVVRIVWGFVGPLHARFSDFIYRPETVLAFLRDSLRMKAPRYLGHNPAGGAMVIALILMIAVICASGVMMGMDAFWGEEWVEDLHELAVWATVGLIGLHLAGVIVASLEHGENLVRAMVTGRKRRE